MGCKRSVLRKALLLCPIPLVVTLAAANGQNANSDAAKQYEEISAIRGKHVD